jgi:alpha-beta hydrolase superfamily lysophospholipase
MGHWAETSCREQKPLETERAWAMIRPATIVLLFTLTLLLSGCAYFRSASDKVDTTSFDLTRVKAEMKPLNLSESRQPTSAIEDYFVFYDLNPTDAQHFFGTQESKGHTLAGHVFLPKDPRGTLFLLHGYFDHVGTLSKLIAESLAQGYAIVAWDLPGHGLSSGERTATGSFDLCAEQFSDIIDRSSTRLPHPFHVIAHSTGCSIVIDYLYKSKTNAFEKVVFLAPLIRHTHWGWAKFGYAAARPFTKSIRRRRKKTSSDAAYLAFVKRDPLHSGVLSFEYLKDLYRWEKRVRDYPAWPGSVVIVQGDRDKVVDWRHSIEFLQDRIEHTEISMIPGARHQLVNESKALRVQVLDSIFSNINQPAQSE